MPQLTWSLNACQAIRDVCTRRKMTDLFYAYFRVAEGMDFSGRHLPLGLPDTAKSRYYFYARFTNNAWTVETELKHEHRVLGKSPKVGIATMRVKSEDHLPNAR
jgi:hypothetical protein